MSRPAPRSMFTLGLLCLVAYRIPAATAQVNTEKMRTGKPAPGLHGWVEGALSWSTGNTDLLQAGAGARFEYNRGVHEPFVQGSYVLGISEGDRIAHNGFLHLRWTAMWHDRVGSELFTQYQFDDFTKLHFRALVGAGVRVGAVLHKIVEVYLGSGYMFEYEDLDIEPANSHAKTTYHHRWTNYLTLRINVKKWLKLVNTLYAQPRFDAFDDVRVLEELGLQFTVYKDLNLVLAFGLRWDSDPPDGVDPLDTSLVTKLRVVY